MDERGGGFRYIDFKSLIDGGIIAQQSAVNSIRSIDDQIRGYISEEQTQRDNQVSASPGTHGLTQQTVAKIGPMILCLIARGRSCIFRTEIQVSTGRYPPNR